MRNHWIDLIVLLGVIAAGWLAYLRFRPAKAVSPEEFTQQFIKKLRAAVPGATVTNPTPMEIHIRNAAGKEATAFLDNAFASSVANPSMTPELIRRHVATLLESLDQDAPIDRSRIVPVIKDRNWPAESRRSMIARGAKDPPENIVEDLNAELVILYAEDRPTSIRYLTPQTLEESGFARKQLRALAVENLRTLVAEPKVNKGPLFSTISIGGDYEASLLLFDDLWTSPTIRVDGEIVVAVPSRELLMFTGSHNSAGIAAMRENAAKAWRESPYRLTDALFAYRNGRFQKLD
jgi:uncharacterized protein YtpQ (UPF0354 family)